VLTNEVPAVGMGSARRRSPQLEVTQAPIDGILAAVTVGREDLEKTSKSTSFVL
jgi:hypothetical protein